jgi:hypothetical protein
MKARFYAIAVLALASLTFDARAQNPNNEQISPIVDINLDGSRLTSNGSVSYFAYGNGYCSGSHFFNDNLAVREFINVTSYNGTISAYTSPSSCYRATVQATGVFGTSQRITSAQACAPPAPPPPPPDLGPQCGDNGWVGQCSPIVINFGRGDYQLTGSNSPVLFDMSGTGTPVKMGWTAAGADEAFLWLDRNHNGKVTGGAELFGNFTPLKDGQLAANGFEALREYDDNRDGVIDERDAVWGRLMLWRDLNHNGISEPNEITTLAGSGVTRIELGYHWTGRLDVYGNAFKYESTVRLSDDGFRPRPKPVYDIFFVRVR